MVRSSPLVELAPLPLRAVAPLLVSGTVWSVSAPVLASPARFSRRLVAAFADAVLVSTVTVGFELAASGSVFFLGDRSGSLALVFLVSAFVLVTLPSLLWGTTLGKRSLGLRLVSAGTASRPPAWRVLAKYLVLSFLALVPSLGDVLVLSVLLSTLLLPSRRSLLDFLFGTRVVSVPVAAAPAAPAS